MRTRRKILRAGGAVTIAGVSGCIGGGSSPAEQARSHRDALSKYTDVAKALEDGYRMSTPYVRSDRGVRGLPFINLAITELEPEQPSMLFYDLTDSGEFELLGVKWLESTESTDSPPSLFGREFDGPIPGETAFVTEHYGLHAWLFEDTADDLFATYHGGVEPPSFIEELETAWEALTPYFSDEAKAESDGFTKTEECIETDGGGYGIQFHNQDFAGTDLETPGVLIYRLTSSWSFNAMGAEWYVPADTTGSPPSMFGQQFHGPTGGHSSVTDQPEHYGLHAWLFIANPNGMFAPYNPTLSC